MGCGIAEGEQWAEFLQTFLGLLAFNGLRFVNNQNRVGLGNNINRAARTELVQFHVNSSGIFALSVECLGIDNHDIDGIIRCKAVNLCQLGRVIDKESDFLAVFFRKMLLGHLKGLIHALTYCDTWYNNDELTPAISTVKLIHCFNVCICFTNTGFHFDSQIKFAFQFHGWLNLIRSLYCIDMFQNQSII